jgi:putative photosynthetic complex assembly protein
LLGAALLIAFTLIMAAVGRLTGPWQPPASEPVATRQLAFIDRPDGSVLVQDVAAGTPVEVFAPGTNNFARGILRALARQRQLRGLGPEQPFVLSRLADGRVTLADPATGESIDLGSFGPTNAADFARLLP